MCLALGVKKLDDLAHEIDELMTPPQPKGMLDALKLLPHGQPAARPDAEDGEGRAVPGGRREGRHRSTSIPILKCWPEDGGRFITLPLVFTKDPETGVRNIGTYRMQVFDGRTTGMHWQRHKGGAQHHRVAERLGKRLEVAVALSPEPVLTYCATAPMPEGLDELLLGGFLSRRRIEMVKCVTVDLEVPASSHIVLEGYVEPGERRREGPFGDHTGFYSQPDDIPVFHLTCITQRKKPTYLTTVVGIPPMEDYYLGMASERIFLPMIRKTVPEIVDMHFPAEGIFHNLVIVSIDKRYPGHARKIMNAFWGLGQLMFSKTIVVVDKDVNVHDVSEVAWIVGTHMDPMRDVQMTKGPVDDLDDAGGAAGVRRQDGHRRDAQVGVGGLHPHLAGAHHDDRAGRAEGARHLESELRPASVVHRASVVRPPRVAFVIAVQRGTHGSPVSGSASPHSRAAADAEFGFPTYEVSGPIRRCSFAIRQLADRS